MSNVNNVLAQYVGTPDATGVALVDRPCNLRGFSISPHGSSDVTLKFYDDTEGGVAANLILTLETASGLGSAGYTLPGLGIRCGTALWITGASPTIDAITVYYQ